MQDSQNTLSLIEAIRDPLLTVSMDGKITGANIAAVKETGIQRENLVGSYFTGHFTEPGNAGKFYSDVFANGTVTDYPLTVKQSDGKFSEVLLNGSVFKDGDGNVLGVLVMARDMAEQKWAIDLRKANRELAFQNEEKEKRAAELLVANEELAFQNEEKGKRADELVIANKELAFQNEEKEKRAAELLVANRELAFQNDEKGKRADELVIANKELAFQNEEKGKRADELMIADNELVFQNLEKEKQEIANRELETYTYSLKVAAEYARSLIEASLDPLVTISAAGKILDVNEASIKVTGVSREKLIETDFSNYFTEPEKAQEGYRQVFEKGFVADYPLTIKHKNGNLTDVLYNASVYKDDKGNVLGVFAAARDITEQKQSSLYARSLIEASLDPLVTISADGKIMDMNEAMIDAVEKAREKLINTDFENYFTDAAKAREIYQEVFTKGYVIDYPLTLKDSKLVDVLFNGSVYKDGNGNVLGAVVVARDISEQKKTEKEMVEAKVFAELATSIAEEEKFKAEAATHIAEDAVKSKQQFLSNMSHEIRTPMNAIIGFTKVLLKTELSAKQREYMVAIKVSGDALIVLINDILDLAKVDAGKMVYEQIPFIMESSIAAMLHLFESKIQEKNISLVKVFDQHIPKVLLGDPVRLHQVITNLLSNAVKFTAKGKITVTTTLLKEDNDLVTIQFVVADTGIGIAEDKLARVFDNFQQASSGTSRLYGGTGLGLSIVKQLVEGQDGSIDVQSTVGEGSEFSFTMNFQKTTEQVDEDSGFAQIVEDVKNIKVLVVEDIALNQLLMKTLLDDFGFERDIASNGKIAIERMAEKNYDIILMDLQMPEMNGFEATAYIRNTLQSMIPIIALTADVTTVDLDKCRAVGMNDYIAKPVDERILYSKIVNMVKRPLLNGLADKSISPVESTVSKCIDLEYLLHRTKSDPVLMMEMISLYLEQTPPLVDAMKKSFDNKDWAALQAAVHKMIPSFSIMGISSDFELMAKKVQEYANERRHDEGMPDLLIKLENICIQACTELAIELDALKHNAI